MARSLTPKQAYKLVLEVAKKNEMTISAWAESCGVPKSTISHWKHRAQSTVMVSTLERLGVQL